MGGHSPLWKDQLSISLLSKGDCTSALPLVWLSYPLDDWREYNDRQEQKEALSAIIRTKRGT